MLSFLGNSEAKTDAKGRVFLPALFRKQLQSVAEEKLIMRKDTYKECLALYPERAWNEDLAELRARLNKWNPVHQDIMRTFVSDVEIIIPDSSGRILIPKRYLAMADIQSDVRFIGVDSRIEIWSTEKADKAFMAPEVFGKTLEEIMAATWEPK